MTLTSRASGGPGRMGSAGLWTALASCGMELARDEVLLPWRPTHTRNPPTAVCRWVPPRFPGTPPTPFWHRYPSYSSRWATVPRSPPQQCWTPAPLTRHRGLPPAHQQRQRQQSLCDSWCPSLRRYLRPSVRPGLHSSLCHLLLWPGRRHPRGLRGRIRLRRGSIAASAGWTSAGHSAPSATRYSCTLRRGMNRACSRHQPSLRRRS